MVGRVQQIPIQPCSVLKRHGRVKQSKVVPWKKPVEASKATNVEIRRENLQSIVESSTVKQDHDRVQYSQVESRRAMVVCSRSRTMVECSRVMQCQVELQQSQIECSRVKQSQVQSSRVQQSQIESSIESSIELSIEAWENAVKSNRVKKSLNKGQQSQALQVES